MPNHILRAAMLGALLSIAAPAVHAAGVDVDAFVKRDTFESIKISPDGQFFAATAPLADRTVLAILQRSDNKVVATFNTGANTHIAAFEWVNPTRVLISTSEKFGQLDQPQLTGEIYGLSTTGSAEILVGQRVGEMATGSRIQRKQAETVAAFLVDDLPGDDRNVVIAVSPFSQDPFTGAELMDVDSGKRRTISRAPVRNARFSTDAKGTVRFAHGVGLDNVNKLYYRAGEASEWRLLNDESVSDRVEVPLGFSGDNATAYLQVEQATGPDAIVAFDVASDTRKQVLRDDNTDPARVIYRAGTDVPVGVIFEDGKPRAEFFDPKSPEARLQRSLEVAFTGHAVDITSSTAGGGQALVHVYSDRNAGDFYIFDTVAKKAQHVISSRTWFDPERMAEMRPVSLAARDGTPLRGFLTIPAGSTGKGLPLVVLPHGGPFGVFDAWGFDSQGQMLAAAGYAVLQVNFRGSANHGRAFLQAGARQWGGTMQDDLTDATRRAIREGHADASRICIFGASYGAYAALMGVAREPSLYRCAAGYVGVYDLPMMQDESTRTSRRFGRWSADWVGNDREKLAAVSPNRMADRIKVPVFLAAGGEDEVAPIAHSERMEKALASAGVPVETLYYKTEGHGFYVDANRREFYMRLLEFLARHIGGAPATDGVARAD